MCDAVKATDMNYDVKIYEARGGVFGSPGRPEMVQVGTGTLTLIGLNKMRFDYDISADSSTTGTGIYDLERLF